MENSIIRIEPLKQHKQFVPSISKIWYEVLGKLWIPEVGLKEIESLYNQELFCNDIFSVTYIALCDQIPIGACTIKFNDGIRNDLCPWLGDNS